MMKDVQETLEGAITEFENWQQAEQERLRERERFETDWARVRKTVVLPALEEVAVLLRKAGWQYQLLGTGNDLEVRLMVWRENFGSGGGHKPYMIYELEKQKNAILVHLTTRGLRAAPVGSFALDEITEDFVQTEATKFFTRVVSEIASPRREAELV